MYSKEKLWNSSYKLFKEVNKHLKFCGSNQWSDPNWFPNQVIIGYIWIQNRNTGKIWSLGKEKKYISQKNKIFNRQKSLLSEESIKDLAANGHHQVSIL